ncbi:UNVERIFIED_ORG: putative DNA-binding transcriptional regulator AlpA [Arthrobacter globiformis]|nr:putative DNA-binding transcriptional regulator AlpA [Arthrobacter globiformis]
MNNDDRLLTVKELAELFQLSQATIYARLPEWPHLRPTPTDVRFSREDIEAIKAMSRKTPSPVMRARSTRMGTERQKARNRAYNRRNGLTESPAPR